jgi:hypothetical protein
VRLFGPSSTSMSAVPGAPPAKLKTPTRASVFGEAPGQSTCLRGAGSGIEMARDGA